MPNTTIAKKIYESYPSIDLLCNHPSPLQSKLYDLELFLQDIVNVNNTKYVDGDVMPDLAQSLWKVNGQDKDTKCAYSEYGYSINDRSEIHM